MAVIYPLWKKNRFFSTPWTRKYTNLDFLESEKKRISDVALWYNKFLKARDGDSLPEVIYYKLPLSKIEPWINVAVELMKDKTLIGLSALRNSLQHPLLLLLPRDCQIPSDYALLKIICPKKKALIDEKKNRACYIISSEEVVVEEPEKIYVDIPFERKPVESFLKENLIGEDQIVQSFQTPILSAPYAINRSGGISLSTLNKRDPFSEELMRTLKMIQPPEFTDISAEYPEKVRNGFVSDTRQGFGLLTAERFVFGKNFFNGFGTNNYQTLVQALVKKESFAGEYSLACSLSVRGDTENELLRDILSKFLRTEVTLPLNMTELKYSDIDLLRTQKAIDESLWLQLANSRQVQPIFDSKNFEGNYLKNIAAQIEFLLETLEFKNSNLNYIARQFSGIAWNNIKRVAQSFSRDSFDSKVSDRNITKALNLFAMNAESLANNPDIQQQSKIDLPKFHESKKLIAIQSQLMTLPLNITELFSRVQEQFKSLEELQKYIDQLSLKGLVWQREQGVYRWT